MANFDRLLNSNFWLTVAAFGAGYMVAELAKNTVSDTDGGSSIPKETYGAGVAVLAAGSGKMRYVGYGGAAHAGREFMVRMGVWDDLSDLTNGS